MNTPGEERLAGLLRAADEMAGATSLGGDMAGRVRQLAHRRRRQQRVTLISIATIAVVTAAGLWLVANSSEVSRTPQPIVATATGDPQQDTAGDQTARNDQLQAEITRLRAEADEREAILRAVIVAQDFLQDPDVTADSPVSREQLRDATAVVLLWYADRARRRGETAVAQSEYENIVRYYSHTRWAQIAQQRLAQQQQEHGNRGHKETSLCRV